MFFSLFGIVNLTKKLLLLFLIQDLRFCPLGKENILGLVSCAHVGHVETVMVDGKILMENRKIKILGEAKMMKEAGSIGDEFFD